MIRRCSPRWPPPTARLHRPFRLDLRPAPGPRAHRQRRLDGHPPEQGRQRAPPGRRQAHRRRYHVNTRQELRAQVQLVLGESLFNGTCNGEPFHFQVERRHKTSTACSTGAPALTSWSASACAAELLALMPEKLPPDLSMFLLSLMLGLLRWRPCRWSGKRRPARSYGHRSAKMENIPPSRTARSRRSLLPAAPAWRWTKSISSSHARRPAGLPSPAGRENAFCSIREISSGRVPVEDRGRPRTAPLAAAPVDCCTCKDSSRPRTPNQAPWLPNVRMAIEVAPAGRSAVMPSRAC